MATKKEKADPSIPSDVYEAMAPGWDKMNALLGGTQMMRAAGRDYLPQHEEETDKAYNERLQVAVLFNQTEMTLNSMVGRPFSEPVILSDDLEQDVVPLLDNIDLQGNNIDVFAREWFRDGFAKALSHVYVDFPRTEKQREDGSERTAADDMAEQVRPYWCHIKPEDIIYMEAEIIDGREVLTEIRIREWKSERDGFHQTFTPQIRIVKIGVIEIWEPDNPDKQKPKWTMTETWTYDLDVIPLITFYANKEGLGMGKLPLGDLADLNITHWQSTSDQRVILTIARFPMLAMTGVVTGGDDKEGGAMRVGPHEFLEASDPQAKFYYVEPEGNGIKAGQEDLDKLEAQMANYGAEFLKKKPGDQTATARALDSAEATSPLQDMVTRFENALNQALQLTGRWMRKKEVKGTLGLIKDFGPEQADAADISELGQARTRRDLSRKSYLGELKRRGILADDFDMEENEQELEGEAFDITGGDPEGTEE